MKNNKMESRIVVTISILVALGVITTVSIGSVYALIIKADLLSGGTTGKNPMDNVIIADPTKPDTTYRLDSGGSDSGKPELTVDRVNNRISFNGTVTAWSGKTEAEVHTISFILPFRHVTSEKAIDSTDENTFFVTLGGNDAYSKAHSVLQIDDNVTHAVTGKMIMAGITDSGPSSISMLITSEPPAKKMK